jgi:catechol 2,3-dioxygenase-like lactoylglutathione lyase family enzyme
MPTNAAHHICVRVENMDRSVAFYRDAFGARVATLPFLIDGEVAEGIMDGPEGVAFRTSILAFDEGGIELFEFVKPQPATDHTHLIQRHIMHVGFQVDDVAIAVERVVRAGGRQVWPDIKDFDGLQMTYVADPDNTIIELVNQTMTVVEQRMLETFPEADPGARTG